MKTTSNALATLAPLLLAAAACDLQLLPEAAEFEGHGDPRMAVVVQADAMPAGDVVAIDLELVDVLLHRPSDDAWVWVAGTAARVELSPGLGSEQSAVPLLADHYDRVLVVIDAPRVAHGGKWHQAGLDQDEFEVEIDLDLEADAQIELRFDLGASLKGNSGKWRFDPHASATIVHE